MRSVAAMVWTELPTAVSLLLRASAAQPRNLSPLLPLTATLQQLLLLLLLSLILFPALALSLLPPAIPLATATFGTAALASFSTTDESAAAVASPSSFPLASPATAGPLPALSIPTGATSASAVPVADYFVPSGYLRRWQLTGLALDLVGDALYVIDGNRLLRKLSLSTGAEVVPAVSLPALSLPSLVGGVEMWTIRMVASGDGSVYLVSQCDEDDPQCRRVVARFDSSLRPVHTLFAPVEYQELSFAMAATGPNIYVAAVASLSQYTVTADGQWQEAARTHGRQMFQPLMAIDSNRSHLFLCDQPYLQTPCEVYTTGLDLSFAIQMPPYARRLTTFAADSASQLYLGLSYDDLMSSADQAVLLSGDGIELIDVRFQEPCRDLVFDLRGGVYCSNITSGVGQSFDNIIRYSGFVQSRANVTLTIDAVYAQQQPFPFLLDSICQLAYHASSDTLLVASGASEVYQIARVTGALLQSFFLPQNKTSTYAIDRLPVGLQAFTSSSSRSLAFTAVYWQMSAFVAVSAGGGESDARANKSVMLAGASTWEAGRDYPSYFWAAADNTGDEPAVFALRTNATSVILYGWSLHSGVMVWMSLQCSVSNATYMSAQCGRFFGLAEDGNGAVWYVQDGDAAGWQVVRVPYNDSRSDNQSSSRTYPFAWPSYIQYSEHASILISGMSVDLSTGDLIVSIGWSDMQGIARMTLSGGAMSVVSVYGADMGYIVTSGVAATDGSVYAISEYLGAIVNDWNAAPNPGGLSSSSSPSGGLPGLSSTGSAVPSLSSLPRFSAAATAGVVVVTAAIVLLAALLYWCIVQSRREKEQQEEAAAGLSERRDLQANNASDYHRLGSVSISDSSGSGSGSGHSPVEVVADGAIEAGEGEHEDTDEQREGAAPYVLWLGG